MQVYEFSLNVSKGVVDATDVYGEFRSDVTTVKVQVGHLFSAATAVCSKTASVVNNDS